MTPAPMHTAHSSSGCTQRGRCYQAVLQCSAYISAAAISATFDVLLCTALTCVLRRLVAAYLSRALTRACLAAAFDILASQVQDQDVPQRRFLHPWHLLLCALRGRAQAASSHAQAHRDSRAGSNSSPCGSSCCCCNATANSPRAFSSYPCSSSSCGSMVRYASSHSCVGSAPDSDAVVYSCTAPADSTPHDWHR
jgi:hypothetical protein